MLLAHIIRCFFSVIFELPSNFQFLPPTRFWFKQIEHFLPVVGILLSCCAIDWVSIGKGIFASENAGCFINFGLCEQIERRNAKSTTKRGVAALKCRPFIVKNLHSTAHEIQPFIRNLLCPHKFVAPIYRSTRFSFLHIIARVFHRKKIDVSLLFYFRVFTFFFFSLLFLTLIPLSPYKLHSFVFFSLNKKH